MCRPRLDPAVRAGEVVRERCGETSRLLTIEIELTSGD